MDTIKYREQHIKSLEIALKQLDKLIIQDIDLEALDPEKAKAAAQGKIEASIGYTKILEMIAEQTLIIQNERDAKEGKGKAKAFSGVESRIK